MAKKDNNKDPYGPVRKTDPYVSGGAYGNSGGSYKNGGEGGNGGVTPPEEDKDSCMVAAAPVVVGIGLVCALARFALRGRRG